MQMPGCFDWIGHILRPGFEGKPNICMGLSIMEVAVKKKYYAFFA